LTCSTKFVKRACKCFIALVQGGIRGNFAIKDNLPMGHLIRGQARQG